MQFVCVLRGSVSFEEVSLCSLYMFYVGLQALGATVQFELLQKAAECIRTVENASECFRLH